MTRQYSILIVTTVHHPLDARIWQRQIKTLLSNGWQVTYAAPFKAREIDLPRVEGLTCMDLPHSYGKRRLRSLWAARKLIERHRALNDLVLLHDPELLLVAGSGRNMIWDVHEDTAGAIVAKPWIPNYLQNTVKRAFGWVERWSETRFKLLLAEYGYVKRFARQHPVVPNAVDVPEFPSARFEPRVVYLGSITLERGAAELAEVGRLLPPGIKLEVIGPAHGESEEILRQADAAGNLVWRGFVPSEQALEMLPGAIAGVSLLQDLPNYRHSMPTKLLEYMGHGVPVVSTPLPVAADLISRAGGKVVPFQEPSAAVEAIVDLWEDHEAAAEIAREAYAVARNDYDWAVHGKKFERILRAWAMRAMSTR